VEHFAPLCERLRPYTEAHVYAQVRVCVPVRVKPTPCESRTPEPLKPTPRESRALNRMAASPAASVNLLQ